MISIISFFPSLISFQYTCRLGFPKNVKFNKDRARATANTEYFLTRGNKRITFILMLTKVLIGVIWVIVQLQTLLKASKRKYVGVLRYINPDFYIQERASNLQRIFTGVNNTVLRHPSEGS
jgi:hypothetical protein